MSSKTQAYPNPPIRTEELNAVIAMPNPLPRSQPDNSEVHAPHILLKNTITALGIPSFRYKLLLVGQ